jgi:glycosyltransferase involved in cell wall biosynthesis
VHVLLNCTTLVKGGALQAAVSFIDTARNRVDGVRWHYMISRNVRDELEEAGALPEARNVSVIEQSPAKSSHSRKVVQALAKEIAPELAFTFFGPAYVQFDVPHLCGVADGWVTHADQWAWRTVRGPVDAGRLLGAILYKWMMFRKADAWVTESATAKEGLVRRLRIPENSIAIVPNNCASHYLYRSTIPKIPSSHDELRILCLSAYYRHKNLEMVPAVAKELEIVFPNRRFKFVMTLPPESEGLMRILSRAAVLGVEGRIVNVGPVPVARGPEVYRSCHILFLPSVLETFSANYPEAMAMGTPVVTTDLSFAREACAGAAAYFRPMDACDAAQAISRVWQDRELWKSLVEKGKQVLQTLPTQEMKYELYTNCLRQLHRRYLDQC